MDQNPELAPAEPFTLHLLDPSQGHPLQTWRFSDRAIVTIGRSEECDVPIADPHVSRIHARLELREGGWVLVSVGRHGTLVNDKLIAEQGLLYTTSFRLGTSGPALRFEPGDESQPPTETIGSSHLDLFAMLELDVDRQRQEADEIAGNSFFRELQEKVRQAKLNPTEEP